MTNLLLARVVAAVVGRVAAKVHIQLNCGNLKYQEWVYPLNNKTAIWQTWIENSRIGLSSTYIATCVIKETEIAKFKKKMSNAWRWEGVGMVLISARGVRS